MSTEDALSIASPSRPGLRAEGVGFAYGGTPVLDGIRLEVAEGEFLCLLGPSGCGKTTLLRLLAGLEVPTTGTLCWQGRAIDGPSLERGVVFQDYSLFPWMTLVDHVTLALAKAHPGTDRRSRSALAEEFLQLVGLGEAASKYPFELSGGMQQRGAIARTLALGSPVLLMDEPFGALDPVNRVRLQDLVLDVWSGSGARKTIVFVTHDLDEALFLADRIVLLGASPGRIIHELRVPFTRPRRRRSLTSSAEYVALREWIAERFRQDTLQRIEAESAAGEGEGI